MKLYYWAVCFLILIILIMFVKNHIHKKTEKQTNIHALVRQIGRWAVASEQDTSPMIAVLHANYAVGYLQALETIATEKEISRFTNLEKLRNKIYKIQDNAVKKAVQSCPNYVGSNIDKELALLGISL